MARGRGQVQQVGPTCWRPEERREGAWASPTERVVRERGWADGPRKEKEEQKKREKKKELS